MPDQEFLASYAVDIDEQGVERLQSILEENRSLAESLSKAFQQAYADLDSFVREAIVSIPSLARFEDAQNAAVDSAGRAQQAILSLTSAYSGLTAAIPDESLDLSITGISGERNESGRKNSEFASWLSDISGSLNRLVMLSAGTDNVSDASGGAVRGAAGAGVAGESALSLNLAGASEELQGFLEELASSEAEIPAGLNLAGDDDDLAALQARAGETEAAMPLRLDRTRAEASLADLRRILTDPVRLTADTAGILSAASSALASIKNSFAGTTLSLKAAVTVSGDDGAGDGGDAGSDAGAQGTSSGSDSPLANALRAAAGGRYTRPTKVEVAEDGDTEYIIPVDKEADAVPLLRQALADLSASARETLIGDLIGAAGDLTEGTVLLSDQRPDTRTVPQSDPPVLAPEIQLPDISVPEIRMPEMKAPDITLPDISIPEINLPAPEAPEINVPEVSVPEIQLPDINIPDIAVPEIKMPEINALELAALGPDRGDSSGVRLDISPDAQNRPPVRTPESTIPDSILPKTEILDVSIPGTDFSGFDTPDIDLSALDALAGLPEMMAAAVAAASAPANVSNIENKSVEAPVNIHVTASGADPQILGQSIYDSAQRYLQKTLRSALT